MNKKRIQKDYLVLNDNYISSEDDAQIVTIEVGSNDVEKTYRELDEIVDLYGVNTVIAQKEQIYYAARLLWNNDNIKQYVLVNTNDAEMNERQNIRAAKLMWDNLANRNMDSNDKVKLSGWIKSDTGEFFSRDEMKEFSDNLYQKIEGIVGENVSVLEIGVASGISCYTIAPLVKKYYGVDISKQILEFTERTLEEKRISNVTLFNCEAVEIGTIGIPNVDLVLFNSVIQYFPGYNYFVDVLKKSINMIDQKGYIFFGDVLDLDLYDRYIEFRGLKSTKYNREQYYSKDFFEKLPCYFGEIKRVIVSDKLGKIKNELNTYRYDVLLEISKGDTDSKNINKKRIAEDLLQLKDKISLKQIIELVKKHTLNE